MRVAVVGGGINGVCCAWELATRGHQVQLFERDRLCAATSAASTKLLHGGLRYLEQCRFRLVREALAERAWWIANAPALARPITLALPVYAWSRRPRWLMRTGLWLYDRLAGRQGLRPHAWLPRDELLRLHPGLIPDDLLGGFTFQDGQMDDAALGAWAAGRARDAGAVLHEGVEVSAVSSAGWIETAAGRQDFDRIANLAGPWARRLLDRSGIPARHDLDLVRGSHLIVDRPCPVGVLAEVRGGRRIAFSLPWQGRTLLGTTEVRQGLDQPIACSAEERAAILAFHDAYFRPAVRADEVVGAFAGLRPLVRSGSDSSRASREDALETAGKLTTVFGGKWTTARALARRVADTLCG